MGIHRNAIWCPLKIPIKKSLEQILSKESCNFVPKWAQIDHLLQIGDLWGNDKHVLFVFLLYLVSVQRVEKKSVEPILKYMSFAVLGLFWVIFWPLQVQISKYSNKNKKIPLQRSPSNFTYPYKNHDICTFCLLTIAGDVQPEGQKEGHLKTKSIIMQQN